MTIQNQIADAVARAAAARSAAIEAACATIEARIGIDALIKTVTRSTDNGLGCTIWVRGEEVWRLWYEHTAEPALIMRHEWLVEPDRL